MLRAKNCQNRPKFHGAIEKSGLTLSGLFCKCTLNYKVLLNYPLL